MTMEHIKRSFQVTLAIRHPNIDPSDISRALSLPPTRQTRAGQQRVTPTGELLKGTYQFSSWGHAFDARAVTDLSEFLPCLLDRLTPHGTYFLELIRDGGNVELFCGVFADVNWDESFHHTLLRRLAEMGIDLRLDVYPKSNEPEV